MDYVEIRDRAIKELRRHPENVDLIVHNAAAALSQEGYQETTVECLMLELNRRWEHERRRPVSE
jgi:hypothetical protein